APSGWVNHAVTMTLDADDTLSGVRATYFVLDGGAQQAGTGVTIGTEGVHTLRFWSVDNADNVEAVKDIQVRIDRTDPTITHGLSGVRSCSGPRTLHEGASQSAAGSATDAAGNGSSATVGGINVDETAPALSGAPTSNPNAAGWYNGDVTVHWTASDGLSGIN